MKRRLSKSQINLYLQCPFKWKKIYIDGIKSKPSKAQERGIKIHEEIQNFYKNIQLISRENTKIPEIKPKKDMSVITKFLDFENKRIKMCVDEKGNFDPKYFKPIFQELAVEDDDLKLRGFIDAVYMNPKDNGIIIIDWKTGRYYPEKFDDYRFELAIYKELFDRGCFSENKVKYWGIYFVDQDKLFFEEVKNKYIDRTFKTIKQVRKDMEINREPKLNCYCNTCQFKDDCPSYKNVIQSIPS